jgi:hypothetical protein
MSKKSNWQVMQGVDERDNTRYRDVYEDQQLERSKIQQKQSPVSRTILAVIMTVLVAALAWVMLSVGQMAFSSLKGMSKSGLVTGSESSTEKMVKPAEGTQSQDYPYLAEILSSVSGYDYKVIVNPETGELGSETYDEPSDVPESAIPSWYKDSESKTSSTDASATDGGAVKRGSAVASEGLAYYMRPVLWKVLADLTISLVFFLMIYQVLMRNLASQNLMSDTTDINQYQNDQHIALPEEVMRKFDFFPDAGAHSNVQVSSMISHVALSNKGINPTKLSVRADKDIKDEDGDIIYLKGEVLTDEDGNVKTKTVPMFDKGFMEDLFTASGALKDKSVRKYYDATKIPYNPGNKDREKQKGYDTVADLINGDWTIPSYEMTTPAGAYVVDTAPVNTMV